MKTVVGVALTISCLMAVDVQSAAEETTGVNLFDRQSLAGWMYGSQPSEGWRMTDAVLQADEGATPLLSGWSWGDVEISFRWRVSPGASWRLALRRVPEGEKLAEVILQESVPASSSLATAVKNTLKTVLPPSSDGWHEATLKRQGGQLIFAAATRARKDNPSAGDSGHVKLDLAAAHDARFAIELALLDGSGALSDFKAQEPAGKPLFNGKDLNGWWTPGNLASWKAQDDSIVCLNQKGNYLRTDREYANFTLSLEYKMAKGGNSGIGIRTARTGWPSGDGMELQMLDERDGTPLTRHSTMALYGNLEPLARADRSQAWNRVVIKAEGYLISAWVTGVLVQHANTLELPELRRRNLKGWIGLQDHGARIEFRNLRLRETPDGLGLEAWHAARPASGSQIVLDRLMNSERLAIDDGLDSGTVQASVEGKDESVLAELSGPGALVEISRSNPAGRLSFHFDGEQTPRLECLAQKLHEYLPVVGDDAQPLLTYVPYRKSLKITLRDADAVEYRLDYVTFPEGVSVEEFAPGQSCVARGLLPALSYRNEQFGWGTHREAGPLPRAGSEGEKIAEQSEATLIDLDGPGIVEWTKLIAAPSLLEDDDLWLHVTVDDEPAPAISAPARWFFPGLAGGNYRNYVVLNRNGWTNVLAMPFAKRLTMTLANIGRRPVQPVGLIVSYQPLDNESDPRLARRLHGVYETQAHPDDRCWIKQSGSGRFVGLITQYGKAGVDALLIDGEPRRGWRSSDWQALMGMGPDVSDERHSLSGRQGGFQWRFFLLAPPQFKESLHLKAAQGPPLGARLALFYMEL